jgi:hypothetical protein
MQKYWGVQNGKQAGKYTVFCIGISFCERRWGGEFVIRLL